MPKMPIKRVLSARKQGRERSFRSRSVVISILVCLSLVVVALIPVAEAAPEGWSEDQRLTDSSYDDVSPQIDVSGDKVHVVWEHQNTSGNSKYDIFYMNSPDTGFSWSSSTLLSRGEESYISRNPDIGVSNDNIHVVWDRGKIGFPAEPKEIYYRNSTDGGLSWNERKMLSEDEGNYSNDPSISVVGNDLHVAWTDLRHSGTEVYYIRSLDGGVTWNDGQGGEYGRRLTNTAGDSIVCGIVKEGNTIHLISFDSTDGDADVYYMVSYDNGANWEDGQGNSNQGRDISGGSTDEGPAALAVNGSTVHVVWCEYDGSDYYIWYRNSTDNGNSWGGTQRLVGPNSTVTWGPELACNESHVYLVWNDQRDDGTHSEVYIMNSTNSGGDWGVETRLTEVDNEHSGVPDIDLENGKKYLVYEDEGDGNDEIYFKRSPDFISVPEFSNLLLPITLMILTYMVISRYRERRKKT